MKSPEHKHLMKAVNQLVRQERWRKIPKAKGKVLEKSLTKSGNVKFVLERKKGNVTFYVLKRNKNLFAAASGIGRGDEVSVALRSSLGKSYCVKLSQSQERRLGEWT